MTALRAVHYPALGHTNGDAMTQHLEAPPIGRRFTKRVLGIVVLGLILAMFSLLEVPVPMLLSIVAFLAAGLFARLVTRHKLSLFRYPQCETAIRDHEKRWSHCL